MTDTAPPDDSAIALAELRKLLQAIEDDAHDPVRGYTTAQARATARSYALNTLHHGLQFWFDADPARPVFHRGFAQTKKLLGDNQDAVYYGTAIDPARTYRIRGNVQGACYTSFTVEAGTQGAHMSTCLSSTLNDTEFDVAPDGSYEILAGPGLTGRNRLGFDPEALEIRGRFPRCRFGNVMLFNGHMQTLPQRTRRSSLNRRQTVLEPDGSFRMIVSARDPGTPNWLDTAGMPYGIVFWRFLLPEEPIPALETRVVTAHRDIYTTLVSGFIHRVLSVA